MKKFILLFILYFINFTTYAQKYIEPIVAYRISLKDVNNISMDQKAITALKQIHTIIQLATKKSKKYEHAFQLNIGIPINTNFIDSSFTTNPALPLYKSANKTLSSFSVFSSFIPNYKIISFTKKDRLNFFGVIGIGFQKINVSYDNDINNYTILNPDKTISLVGVQFGFGFQYIHSFAKGRIFLQSQLDFPILTKRNKYPTPLKSLLPTGIALGYSFELKNKKDAK